MKRSTESLIVQAQESRRTEGLGWEQADFAQALAELLSDRVEQAERNYGTDR